MIKIGIVSDLHLKFWRSTKTDIVQLIKDSVAVEKPDILIDAGDWEINYEIEDLLILKVFGNHDYYGDVWKSNYWISATQAVDVKGVRIGLTTLWVDFKNQDPYLMRVYEYGLVDTTNIENFSARTAYETHLHQKHWLIKEHKEKKFDVIVTHHTPTLRAIHPRYIKDPFSLALSFGFSSDLDDLVENLAPKYWIFGHTHDPYDFMIGKTRMISNPCGYPGEGKSHGLLRPYKPIYIEIDNEAKEST